MMREEIEPSKPEHIDFDKIPLSKAQRKKMEAWFKKHPPRPAPGAERKGEGA